MRPHIAKVFPIVILVLTGQRTAKNRLGEGLLVDEANNRVSDPLFPSHPQRLRWWIESEA
jgi:hypothetical protein